MSQGLTRAFILGLKESEVKVVPPVLASVWASVGASVRASVGDSVWASVGASVRASVMDSVWASVGASVRASVGDSVWASVWASVRASVMDSVGASVRASVGDSVMASVGDSVGDSVRASVGASCYGQHDANWIGFYDYFRVACSLYQETMKLDGLLKIAESAGWWLPHQKICWISERHTTLYRNTAGQLHKDGGMALAYPDGWGIYALNGIRMKAEYVLTPAEQLTPEKVLAEPNADIRRELIRKVGIERMLAKLPHKSLDKRGNYELLSVRLSEEVQDARYLKMVNPSISCYHIEGVEPSCKTVIESLNWRNQNWHEDAEILT
jgi:hypothetical protein